MKNIDIRLKEHYKSSVLTICKCWKVTRKDGQIFAFTDLDKDLIIDDIIYKGSTGFISSAIETQSAFGVDNLNIESILDDESITEEDLKKGLWDAAEIVIFEVNYEDLTMGKNILRTGYIGEVKSGKMRFETELRGLSQRLQTQTGRIYNPACDANLGDSRCKVDLEPLKVYLVVSQVISKTHFKVSQASVEHLNLNYFTSGLVEFNSGLNENFKSEVKSFNRDTGDFLLHIRAPYEIKVGDFFIGTPGCVKTTDACKSFDNFLNFRGFPDIPGQDKLISGK